MAGTLAAQGGVFVVRTKGEKKTNTESRQRSGYTGSYMLHKENEE